MFAFSTENWGRPDDEVADLMVLFEETIREQFPDLHRQGVRMHFIGRRDRCPHSLRELMQDMETRTRENTRLDLWVAFDYGARAEVVPRPAGWWPTGWKPMRSTRRPSQPVCTLPRCPIPTW